MALKPSTNRQTKEFTMIMQTVKFESTFPEAEVLRIADERADDYRQVPGLLEKYYLKLDRPNHFGGVLIWESKEAMSAFAQTELAKTIPTVYGVKGEPCIKFSEIFEVLRG
jgi:heme-degrading monooxygenase HmoA